MSEDLLLHYAKRSHAPEHRVRDFLLRDPRFSWGPSFIKNNPGTNVSLAGSGLRDILLGLTPDTLVTTIHGALPKDVRRHLARHGNVDREDGDAALTFRPKQQPESTLYILFDVLPPQDFTIDSLVYSLRRDTLHDSYNGLADLHARKIRVPGYPLRTFANDPLRMLRALRLAATHGLTFAPETWHALTCSLPRLNKIHRNDEGKAEYKFPRRVLGSAFLETLAADPAYGSSLIEASGLGSIIAPELFADNRLWAKTKRALDTLVHADTRREFRLAGTSIAVIIAALFMYHERNSTLARDVMRRFHLAQFPKGHAAQLKAADVAWILENLKHFHEHDPASMAPSAFEKMFSSERGKSLLALMHAGFLAEGTHHVARERLHIARRLLDNLSERVHALPKLVRGRDLTQLGINPGPLYRDLMKKVRDAQLAGQVQNKEDALSYLRHHMVQM